MGGLLLCPRLALPRHKEEAHYCKQSGRHEDYKHMGTRGIIKLSVGTWRMFKNLEQTNTPICPYINRQFFNLVACQCEAIMKVWQSLTSPHSDLCLPFFYITLSCLSFCLPHNNSITVTCHSPFSWLLDPPTVQINNQTQCSSADQKKCPAQPPRSDSDFE